MKTEQLLKEIEALQADIELTEANIGELDEIGEEARLSYLKSIKSAMSSYLSELYIIERKIATF